jgi:hypothetical protein
MNQSKRLLRRFIFPLLLLIPVTAAYGQTDTSPPVEPSYEVTLHIVVGSNETGPRDLPNGLPFVPKNVKNNFAYSNYRLVNTIFGRVSNTGTIEYKSVSNVLGKETDAEADTFLEWSMANFRAVPNGFLARAFRFEAKLPMRTGGFRDAGSTNPIVNYQTVGISTAMLGFPANKPTLVGTITLPRTVGTLFLVATARTAEL